MGQVILGFIGNQWTQLSGHMALQFEKIQTVKFRNVHLAYNIVSLLFSQQAVFLMIFVRMPTQLYTVAVDAVVHTEIIIVVHTLD